jgi:hypothetical protein
MTAYQINLVNQTASTQTFAVFLAPPPELNQFEVFPVSSAFATVAPNQSGVSVVLPVQYVVGAGASNVPIGPGVTVAAQVTQRTAPGESWLANYATSPPNMGPALVRAGTAVNPATIAIASNAFNAPANWANRWFQNQWFGMISSMGFIGMVWEPEPQQGLVLTPAPTFLVAVGGFAPYQATSWGEIAQVSTTLRVPADFTAGQATVTAAPDGGVRLVGPGEARARPKSRARRPSVRPTHA